MALPADKNKAIRDFQSEIMGTNVEESIQQDRCVSCRKPAVEFRDQISRREFTLSGLCQSCQDIVFAPPCEEEDDQ
jgi:hypothetical protein